MTRYFLDTSALVKHYHNELGTDAVDRIIGEAGAELLIARLTLVETISVFAIKVRTGEFDVLEFARLRALFATHIARRRYQVFRLLNVQFARGGNLLYAFSHSLVVINMRIAMGIPDQAGNQLSDANAELNQWLTEANDVVRSSSDMKNPRLCGEALYTRAIIIFAVHSFGLLLITPEARQQKSQFIIDTIIPSLHNAIQLYEIADDIEGVLRAKVLMAEFYDLVGDRKRGHDLAVEARPKIKAFDFKDLSVQVDALIDGQPASAVGNEVPQPAQGRLRRDGCFLR